ncbi:uncharacterized protein LOC116344614 [Contarinia nasturtii]|uniref:uncharacterized protein LOC116344614 n=1 Tax=Contarinia nasturtii TaxID=265458 RepID=UPI0012D3FF0A|nr:uncharacterized protein LOC116344614 [Contarinia nasturtii]
MKTIFRVVFLTLLTFMLFEWNIFTTATKNTINFERATCAKSPNGNISYLKCDIRHVSRRHVRVDVALNLTKPVKEALMHIVLYYKYNTYQRFAINLWEDACFWISHMKKSFFLDWTLKRFFNLPTNINNITNINHPCPYEGFVYVKINNVSVDQFPFEQFIPSGRYRLDVDFTRHDKKTLYASAKLYFSVSDLRIEQF